MTGSGPRGGESNVARSRGRARGFLILGLLVGVTAGAAAGYVHWFRTHRLLAVTEGEVYRAGEMAPGTLRREARRHGIRAVIDLRRDAGKAEEEREILEELGVRHFHLPSEEVPTAGTVAAFLQILDRPEYRPVLIHCTFGVGRSGVFAAIFRMEYEGWGNERARREAMWLSGLESFHADSRNGRFLREYVTRGRN
jgi:protein tyrosine/serine phosphatase